MENYTLIELYQLKNRLIKENINLELLDEVLESIRLIEDRIVEGDIGVSAHPTDLSKTPIGPTAQYGTGADKYNVSLPYNPSGGNKMNQKMAMSKGHGPRTGKKSREKKVDMKALRAALKKRKDFTSEPGERKVMNFDNFTKDSINTIKR